ncbi:hypothetical protein P170DRAFT_512037 [Aspergillus steynii IBT 23096]|uniref:Zn(2)-C6 fungal-type domain-containing protein n=1 Tax=Aspergillus steynii IBT 23096 TaxID=1392250 RepID=A0A2I2G3I5_9EURO|nr:uncharacterized protein P170DRAFT_512037 [Aspergillus steynii IBT 23096]PLB47442.1 hypothetical protein P170DRAFT_512037 [Aspergillus steynii IBT 23096]
MAGPQSSRVGTVRRAKACNTCRRKKTKCDGKRPICSSCHAFNFSCTFQDTLKEPNRSSRAYVADLERRVQSMEEQLQHQSPSRTLHENPVNLDDQSTPDPGSPTLRDGSEIDSIRAGNHTSRERRPDDAGDEDGSTDYDSGIDQTSYVINGRDGRMRFFGASSGLSAAAAHATSRATGPGVTAWRPAVRKGATQWQLTSWFPRVLQDDFEKRAFQPLPSKNITTRLVDEYFADLNQAIPLFNKASFMMLLERQFSWSPDESPSWWASLNVVLAFAYRQRAQTTDESGESWQLSLGHIKNAMNVVVEFFMRAADLLTVQAMLGLAIYFQGTPNPQSLFMFASAAMRLSQSIGLHRGFTFGLTTPEVEERRRAFWVAFVLDADISLRVGRPPVQDEHDYDTPLPAESPVDGKGILTLEEAEINFFRLLSQLSLIQRRMYQHLYAASVQQQPRASLLKEVKGCEDALVEWKQSLPITFESYSTSSQISASQHILRLKFAYYCCYANLYRARVFESSYQWNVLYFPAAASGTLALGIFMTPGHETASHDLSLICETIDYLSEISTQEPGTYVDHVLSVCAEFKAASKRALEHRPRSTHQRLGNAHPMDAEKVSNVSMSRAFMNEEGMDAAPSTEPITSSESLNSGTTHMEPLNSDLALFDVASDPVMNWQWSIPPFWNWQDMMSGAPGPGMGNENSPDFHDQSLGV